VESPGRLTEGPHAEVARTSHDSEVGTSVVGDGEGRVRRSRGEPRRLLLNAAREVFAAKGFAGASTREIADRAGVSETLMFRHFGSKVGLFREALVAPFAEFVRSFNERWLAAASSNYDVAELTDQFVSELFDLFRSNRGLVIMLWAADAHTESELAESGVFDEVVDLLQTLVRIGDDSVQRLGVTPSVRQELMTRSTISMIAGMAVFGDSFYGAEPPARREIVRALARISLRSHLLPDD
jgi:AcrR family transcriptional regulator